MKRSLIVISVSLILIATIIGAGGCAWSPLPESTSGVSPGESIIISQQNTGIWVSGEGKVTVVPDVAILSLGVEAQATTVEEAQRQAAIAMDAVMTELDEQGVDDKDIKTQRYSIYPVRRWRNDVEILLGYRVSNMVTAKIREVDNTGAIIDAVAGVGGDYIRINDISFTIDDPSRYKEEARGKAMADAEAKAKHLADLADVKLGKPVYINESGGYIPVVRDYLMGAEGFPAPSSAPTPISPGEMEISLTVQVAYTIT